MVDAASPPPSRTPKKRKAAAAAAGASPPPTGGLVRLTGPVDGRLLLPRLRPVALSREDTAPEVDLDAGGAVASATGGYRTARATHGAWEGTWYFEVAVEALGATGAVRLGWAPRTSELQAPVGCDARSFAYRSAGGEAVHAALRRPYGAAFGEGDVVGCVLHLPPGGRPRERSAADVVRHKKELYYADDADGSDADADAGGGGGGGDKGGAGAAPPPLPGSYVAWTLNGVPQGVAFEGAVPEGTYYPAVSLYTAARAPAPARVRVNFGAAPWAHGPPAPAPGAPPARPAAELPCAAPPGAAHALPPVEVRVDAAKPPAQ